MVLQYSTVNEFFFVEIVESLVAEFGSGFPSRAARPFGPDSACRHNGRATFFDSSWRLTLAFDLSATHLSRPHYPSSRLERLIFFFNDDDHHDHDSPGQRINSPDFVDIEISALCWCCQLPRTHNAPVRIVSMLHAGLEYPPLLHLPVVVHVRSP